MYRAREIARWFIAWANADDEAALTNLKLQKLLYYAQGTHFAVKGEPLFEDEIQAWAHGPVIPDVYHCYKQFGGSPVSDEEPFEWTVVDREDAKILVLVWNTFGSKSAWKLREMTHQESPWLDHYRDGVPGITIPKEDIAVFFKSNVAMPQ
ncbi:Panacea domain-containing protein [Demequina sp.]|uniref:Panacea domain-containing protein n=1 Tax=Demequina sp. TaxID=2050685 RepID=UPI003A8A9206